MPFTTLAAERSAQSATRSKAHAAFLAAGLPTTSDEVWRYAPLADFNLDRFVPAEQASGRTPSAFAATLSGHANCIITIDNGHLVSVTGLPAGVTVSEGDAGVASGIDPAEHYADDAFALLNLALAPSTVRIDVAAGTRVDSPILIVQVADGSASFPRVEIIAGERSSVRIIEYFEGGDEGLVVPLAEYRVGAGAQLDLVTYQRLAHTAWHVARTTGYVERDAKLSQSVVGFGGAYDRCRNDAVLVAPGAHNELRTTFLGAGAQVHDFRTHQFHQSGRTTSVLLSKGAVADESRSIYTGLIEIEKGARRTDARQTNHNLLLSPHAHADSVPNLDIRENDVVCAHASSVGPLDELQRWYLESRGVPRSEAERLMIQGFYYEMLANLPAGVADVVERDVADVLAAARVGAA